MAAIEPIQVLREAIKAVPAVKYALGVVGVGAAAAVILALLGHWQGIPIIFGGVLVGMVLLFVFTRLVESSGSVTKAPVTILVWCVIIFFCVFMILTVTVFTIDWPPRWGFMIGGIDCRSGGFRGMAGPQGTTVFVPDQSSFDEDAGQSASQKVAAAKHFFETARDSYDSGDYSNATVLYRASIEQMPTMSAWLGLGNALFYQNEYSDSEDAYNTGLRMATERNLPSRQGAFLINLGNVALAKNELKQALNYFEESLNLSKIDKEAEASLGAILGSIGNVLLHQGELEKATHS